MNIFKKIKRYKERINSLKKDGWIDRGIILIHFTRYYDILYITKIEVWRMSDQEFKYIKI